MSKYNGHYVTLQSLLHPLHLMPCPLTSRTILHRHSFHYFTFFNTVSRYESTPNVYITHQTSHLVSRQPILRFTIVSYFVNTTCQHHHIVTLLYCIHGYFSPCYFNLLHFQTVLYHLEFTKTQ